MIGAEESLVIIQDNNNLQFIKVVYTDFINKLFLPIFRDFAIKMLK